MTDRDSPNEPGVGAELEHFEEGVEAAPPGTRVMAVLRWALVALMAGAAVLSFVYAFGDTSHAEGGGPVQYYCPMHPSVVQDHPGECPICSMTLVQREGPDEHQAEATKPGHEGHRHEPSDPYFCPMHPEETGDEASDRCPLCSMKLEQRTSTAPPPTGTRPSAQAASKPASGDAPALAEPLSPLELTQDRVQLIGMKTAQVTREGLSADVRAVGYVTAPESGLAVVQTRFSGWIQELHVAQTGQLVQRGQLLARVYSPELLAAQQELLNARRWSASATGEGAGTPAVSGLAQSARDRLELLGMHPEEITQVERAGTPHKLVELRSPTRGYVAQKNAIEGLYIQPGTRLFDIADLSKAWVIVELFERDAGRVSVGQRVSLHLTAYPGEEFVGTVQFLYPMIDPETRTQRARIEFPNPRFRLRPGMFGELLMRMPSTDSLVVPREAVIDTGDYQYVFVTQGEGRFAPRAVRLGMRSDERVQVLAGLSEGESVVTTGNFLLDSESRLRSAIEGASHKPAGTH
ncbi:MAG: efflux RND transporter periplasmic adaptor subunit [Myxococcales bacterium]